MSYLIHYPTLILPAWFHAPSFDARHFVLDPSLSQFATQGFETQLTSTCHMLLTLTLPTSHSRSPASCDLRCPTPSAMTSWWLVLGRSAVLLVYRAWRNMRSSWRYWWNWTLISLNINRHIYIQQNPLNAMFFWATFLERTQTHLHKGESP